MKTVEVVVKIPQGVLNTIWAYVQSEIDNKNIISDTAYKAIVNGTILPKGHGRLIDADTYRKEMLDSREFDFFKRLDMQPTIIEADEGEE